MPVFCFEKSAAKVCLSRRAPWRFETKKVLGSAGGNDTNFRAVETWSSITCGFLSFIAAFAACSSSSSSFYRLNSLGKKIRVEWQVNAFHAARKKRITSAKTCKQQKAWKVGKRDWREKRMFIVCLGDFRFAVFCSMLNHSDLTARTTSLCSSSTITSYPFFS